MLKRVLFSLFLLSLLASGVAAEENIEDDLSGFEEESFSGIENSDLEGFDDDVPAIEDYKSNEEDNDNYTLSGNVAFKTSLAYKSHEVDDVDYSGINQAQVSLYLQLDTKLSDDWKLRVSGDTFYDAIYDLRSQEYRQETLDDYQTQLRLDDTYIQGRLSSNLDVKAGRQIVVWGKSDNIRITDVVNPLDNRFPAMTDIEDLRLSVGMVKFDYALDAWNLSAMVIAENRIMLEATARSEFFPVESIFSTAPDPFLPLITPATSWDNMQYAFAANGVFSGWDLSFYAADVLDQKWHMDKVQGSAPLGSVNRVVSKVKMLGSAINIARGAWLLKAEAAFLNGVKYNTTADDKNRLDTLIGVEYMGIKDSSISFEIANRHIFDYEGQMQYQADFVDTDEVQSALRATRTFLNDTLTLTGLLSMFGSHWENGGFARIWTEYDIMDAVSVSIGVIDYIGGEKPFLEAIKNNDRVFVDMRYSF